MLVTTEMNERNRLEALAAAGLAALKAAWLGWLFPVLWLLVGLSPLAYWWVRRRCLRRLAVMRQPFPAAWETILRTHVAFLRALDGTGQARFRQLVQIFLDEAENDLQKLKASLETWFNEAMDRVSGWYKQKAQVISFVLGAFIVTFSNADTVQIVKTLSNDPTLSQVPVQAIPSVEVRTMPVCPTATNLPSP